MRDYVSLGTAPYDEDCVSVGEPDYENRARDECHRFINFLRSVHGLEQGSARLRIKSNPHDFGSYLDVVCEYDINDEVGRNYAYQVEQNVPAKWVLPGVSPITVDYVSFQTRINGDTVNIWVQNSQPHSSALLAVTDILETIIETLAVRLQLDRSQILAQVGKVKPS